MTKSVNGTEHDPDERTRAMTSATEVVAALEAMPDDWKTRDDYGAVRLWLRNAGLRAPGDIEEWLEHRRDFLEPFLDEREEGLS